MDDLYGERGANTPTVWRARQRMAQMDAAKLPRCPHGYVGGTCSVCEWMKGKR